METTPPRHARIRRLSEDQPLHPLHTPQFVADYVLLTGRLPGKRATGRTTAAGLELIAKAMREPHVWHDVRDHHDATLCHVYLRHMMQAQVEKLGLRHFRFRDTQVSMGCDV